MQPPAQVRRSTQILLPTVLLRLALNTAQPVPGCASLQRPKIPCPPQRRPPWPGGGVVIPRVTAACAPQPWAALQDGGETKAGFAAEVISFISPVDTIKRK